MIVAADSRYTTGGSKTHCDNAEKIISLEKHPRAIVANTGFSEFQGPIPIKDPCNYAKTHLPKLSIGMLARDFLDAQHGEILEETFTGIAPQLVKRLQALPTPPEAGPDGKILELTFGHYDVNSHVSVIAWFDICQDIPHTNHYSVCIHEWTNVAQTDVGKIQDFGDTQCATKALSESGRQLLGPQFLNDFDHLRRKSPPTVVGVTHREALAAAVDLINSTVRINELSPDPACSVGGPIKAILLDENHPRPFKLLP